jgi:hypothetical protein
MIDFPVELFWLELHLQQERNITNHYFDSAQENAKE